MTEALRLGVRDAEDQDFQAISAIYAHHILYGTASFEMEPPGVDEMTRRWRAITAQGLPYVVVAADERIYGYGYASSFRPRPAYRHTVEDSVYVGAEYLRMGVGSLLLTTLIERCRAEGYRRMVAVVGDSVSNAASIGLHEKHGFEADGRLPDVGRKFGRWLDIVLLSRSLSTEGIS